MRAPESELRVFRQVRAEMPEDRRCDKGRAACLMDEDEADLKKEIQSRLEAVHALTEGFFTPSSHSGKQTPEKEDRDESFENIVAGWLTYPALRSKRALKTFERLKPELIRRLKTAGKPQ